MDNQEVDQLEEFSVSQLLSEDQNISTSQEEPFAALVLEERNEDQNMSTSEDNASVHAELNGDEIMSTSDDAAEVNDTSPATPVASTSRVPYTRDSGNPTDQESDSGKTCKECGKTFSRSGNCRRHMDTVHNIERFKCGFRNCTSDFTRKDDRIRPS